MNALIEAVTLAYRGRDDYFAGGNMFVYYSVQQARNRDFKGPDVFVTLNVDGTKERQGWVVWEENGRYPDVIIELRCDPASAKAPRPRAADRRKGTLGKTDARERAPRQMSPSTAAVDKGKKKDLYEQTFKTGHYFIYDPFDPKSLQGWKLGNNFRYEEITPDDRGWLWCDSLGLWLGTWSGTILRETATWLRFYDEAGNLVKLSFELAEQERERAERAEDALAEERRQKQQLRSRLQEMGIDPERLV